MNPDQLLNLCSTELIIRSFNNLIDVKVRHASLIFHVIYFCLLTLFYTLRRSKLIGRFQRENRKLA